jgi:hypothetical protein
MMKLVLATVLAFTSLNAMACEADNAKTKTVCVTKLHNGKPKLDDKGKPQQECREVIIHKKLTGTEIPKK